MDSLSLTLTIGPVLLKAAKLAKLCRDIQNTLPSSPSTLELVSTECTGIHGTLERYQALCRRDPTDLAVADGIENFPEKLDRLLDSIEKHVQDLESSGKIRTDQENEPNLNLNNIKWNEEQVQLLLAESKQYRSNLEGSLKHLKPLVVIEKLVVVHMYTNSLQNGGSQ